MVGYVLRGGISIRLISVFHRAGRARLVPNWKMEHRGHIKLISLAGSPQCGQLEGDNILSTKARTTKKTAKREHCLVDFVRSLIGFQLALFFICVFQQNSVSSHLTPKVINRRPVLLRVPIACKETVDSVLVAKLMSSPTLECFADSVFLNLNRG